MADTLIRPALVGTAAGLAAAATYIAYRELSERFAAPVLLTKASYADPTKVGDCPFSHVARIAYHLAGKPLKAVPVLRDEEGKLVDPPHIEFDSLEPETKTRKGNLQKGHWKPAVALCWDS